MVTIFQAFNGISIFHDTVWRSKADVCLFTDSSAAKDKGFGAYFGGKWICAPWPATWVEEDRLRDITLLEFFPILVAVYIWGDQLKNKKVLFKCDNKSVVQVINRQTSKSSELMVLVRALTLKCLQLNLILKAEHIPGVHNNIADSLSRFQMSRFRELAPEAERDPVTMPNHLWNIFKMEPDSF